MGSQYGDHVHGFWATVCKTVRPMQSDRCLSCLSVCDVGVLWQNGLTVQDETWHAFVASAKVRFINALNNNNNVGLGPGHIVLDGNQGRI